MALSGKMYADFSSFSKAVETSLVQLRSFETGANKVGPALNRVSDSLSGRKIVSEATLAAKAVDEIGGVSRLTEKELARVGATATEAAAKMRAMGIDVPPGIQKIADAVKAVEAPTAGLSTQMVALGSFIGNMAANAVTALGRMAVDGIQRVIAGMGDMILAGAGVADVEENFERLTAQAGLLGDTLLGTLRAGTHGTITDFELMKTVNQDLAAGLRLTDASFATLSKGAFALAQATGGDVKTALDTMNDAMLTGRTRSLALLTGKIDQTAAEHAYATSLGVSAKELSEAGKLEASRIAILKAVGEATERLGEQTDGLDERVAQVQVSWANFREGLGKTIAQSPVLEAALNGVQDALVQAFGGSQQTLVDTLARRFDEAAISIVGMAQSGVTAVGFLGHGLIALKVVVGDVIQVVDGLRVVFMAMSKETAKMRALQFPEAAAEAKRLDEAYGNLLITMYQRGQQLQKDSAAHAELDKVSAKLAATIGTIRTRMQEATRESVKSVDVNTANTRAVKDQEAAFVKDGKAVKTFADIIKEANKNVSLFTTSGLQPVPLALKNMNVSLVETDTRLKSFTAFLPKATLDLGQFENAIYALPPALKSAGDSAQTALVQFEELGAVGQIGLNIKDSLVGALADVPGILEDAFTGASLEETGKNVGALIGSAIGGAIGAYFGGPAGFQIGSAAGAAAGAGLAEGFRTDGEDVVRRIGADWGLYISEEIGNAIARDAHNLFKSIGSEANLQAAEVYNLGNIIKQFGVDADTASVFVGKLRDTFVFLADGTFSATQATRVLDESFGALADHATENGALVSAALLEIIHLTDQAGLSSQAVNNFVTGQVSSALSGITAMVAPAAAAMNTLADQQSVLDGLRADARRLSVGGSAAEIAANAQALQNLAAEMATTQQIIDATAISSQSAANGLTGALFASFGELTARGMSAADAIEAMTPTIDALQVQLLAAGFDGGAAFAQIQSMAALAADEVAGPALEAIHGAAQALAGLHNAGILNQDMFAGLSSQATSTFNAMVAQGHDAAAAMALIAPDLQRIWQLQQDFGYTVDESTQALLDQALQAGQVGEAHRSAQDQAAAAMERTATATERVAEVLERTFGAAGEAGEDFAQQVNAALDTIPREITIRVQGVYSPPSGIGGSGTSAPATPGFASGTGGKYLDFGRGTLTTLHGRERVMTEAEGRTEGGGGNNSAALAELVRVVTLLPTMVATQVRDQLQLGKRYAR